jgi:hypothetical protein
MTETSDSGKTVNSFSRLTAGIRGSRLGVRIFLGTRLSDAPLQGTFETMEKLTCSRDLASYARDCISWQKLQAQCEFKLCVDFGKRSKRNAHVVQERSLATMSMTFCNVARNRRGCAS